MRLSERPVPEHYRTVRYTVELEVMPGGSIVRYRAVTSWGELKAAVMAYARLRRDDPEARIAGIEIVDRETEFTIDPKNDALDYWGGCD